MARVMPTIGRTIMRETVTVTSAARTSETARSTRNSRRVSASASTVARVELSVCASWAARSASRWVLTSSKPASAVRRKMKAVAASEATISTTLVAAFE